MPRRKKNPDLQPTETMSPPGANGGQLRKGNPGNRGGPGPTPAVMRMRFRKMLMDNATRVEKALQAAADIVEAEDTSRSMKLNAAGVVFDGINTIGKYSGTATVSLTDADGQNMDLPPLVVQVAAPLIPPAE